MIKILKDKKGEIAYIYLCVIVLIIAILFSFIILYMSLCSQIQIQKRDVKHKIDGYLSEVATEEFSSIKKGEVYAGYVDYDALKNGVFNSLGFFDHDEFYEYQNRNCTMTRPNVTVLRGDGFGVRVEYTAIFRVEWNGKAYTSLKIPLTVTGYFKIR